LFLIYGELGLIFERDSSVFYFSKIQIDPDRNTFLKLLFRYQLQWLL